MAGLFPYTPPKTVIESFTAYPEPPVATDALNTVPFPKAVIIVFVAVVAVVSVMVIPGYKVPLVTALTVKVDPDIEPVKTHPTAAELKTSDGSVCKTADSQFR